jgi:hypothetical protein
MTTPHLAFFLALESVTIAHSRLPHFRPQAATNHNDFRKWSFRIGFPETDTCQRVLLRLRFWSGACRTKTSSNSACPSGHPCPTFCQFNSWASRASSQSSSLLPGVTVKVAMEWGWVSWRGERCLYGVGCLMKPYKAFPFLTLLACLSLSSCYHEFPGSTGTGGGGTTASISFTMVADTPPANLGLISFKVVPSAITLTPSSGTATTFNINSGNGYSFDLVRLQSDSAFLGTATSVPTGTYTSIAVTFSSAEVAFYNGNTFAITGLSKACPSGAICFATFPGPFTSTITTSEGISANAGFGIDVNLANALSVPTGTTTLSLNFTNTTAIPVVSVFTLPRDPNLTSGQLELIEDFTGIATVSGTSVTIAPASAVNRGSITAATTSSTSYNVDPTGLLCGDANSLSTCFTTTNEAASMDAILNSNGTLTVQEIEPLLASPVVDTVEGTVVSIPTNTTTQFVIVITDIIPAASGSLISSLGIGAPLTVNLATGPSFWVDSKGLPVSSNGAIANFQNQTDTTAIHLGQSVAVHVKAFTAASGTTAAIANNVDTVTLRWSRFIATLNTTASPEFNIQALPLYFGFAQTITFDVLTYPGSPGGNGITNFDYPTSGLVAREPVGIRALFLENTTNTQDPAFFAAKVRQQ